MFSKTNLNKNHLNIFIQYNMCDDMSLTVYEMKLDYVDMKNRKQTLTDDAVNFLIDNSDSQLYSGDGELGYIFINPAQADKLIEDAKIEFEDKPEVAKEIEDFVNKFIRGKTDDVLFSVI